MQNFDKKRRRLFLRLMILLPIAIFVLLLATQLVFINRFNRHVYSVFGADESQETFLYMEPRDDSTSSWVKRDFTWNGKTIDLNAQTIDGVLHNNSKELINNWTIRFDITGDCFVNNAWCGTMEIHQKTKDGEKEQTLDLRKYDINDVTLDHIFDGDLLIPLHKGDYIIYYPSEVDNEIPISGESELTMGVIFYYFDTLDFYDYTLSYTFHRSATQGPLYYAMLAVGVLLLIGIAVYLSATLVYKDAKKQLELKKSALSTMSDIYHAIYLIDLTNDTLMPVFEKLPREKMGDRPQNLGASEQIRNMFEMDAEDAYKEIMIDFGDLSKLPERMEGRQSLAGEYISKINGWCSVRFFAMDQIEGREIDRAVFTIQVIDAEKREIDAITEKITQAEQEHKVNASLLTTLSEEMLVPVRNILDRDKELQIETKKELIQEHSRKIRHEANILKTILGDIRDYARLEAGQLSIEHELFPLSELIEGAEAFASESAEEAGITFKTDIKKDLPKQIAGDQGLLSHILEDMLAIAVKHTAEGSICLSVFGKKTGGKTHLVFSVRDTGDGKDDEENRELGFLLCRGLLLKMGTQLQIVSAPGIGTEAYFELETETDESERKSED